MFDKKELEPKLSQELQDIINRSIDSKTNNNTDDIFRYKYKIMKILTSSQDLLKTLHNDELQGSNEIINGDLYRNVCIFDFMKLPNNKSQVKNYVCFEVNDNGAGDLTTKTIVFRTVSHEDDHVTDWNISRQDLLALIIKNEFDWSNVFGMHVEKQSDNGYVTSDGNESYYYREIVYRTAAPNNIYNKINNIRR